MTEKVPEEELGGLVRFVGGRVIQPVISSGISMIGLIVPFLNILINRVMERGYLGKDFADAWGKIKGKSVSANIAITDLALAINAGIDKGAISIGGGINEKADMTVELPIASILDILPELTDLTLFTIISAGIKPVASGKIKIEGDVTKVAGLFPLLTPLTKIITPLWYQMAPSLTKIITPLQTPLTKLITPPTE